MKKIQESRWGMVYQASTQDAYLGGNLKCTRRALISDYVEMFHDFNRLVEYGVDRQIARRVCWEVLSRRNDVRCTRVWLTTKG